MGAVLSIITAIVIVWVNFRDRGEHQKAKRVASFLLVAALLVAAVAELKKIELPAVLSSIVMVVAVAGAGLGVWAYWAGRTAHVTS